MVTSWWMAMLAACCALRVACLGAEALPRTVTVTPGGYKVAYPTNFWEANSNELNRVVAQQSAGGVAPSDLLDATNKTFLAASNTATAMDAAVFATTLNSIAISNAATLAAANANSAAASNATATASGIVNATTPIAAINTNYLKFYGANTTVLDNAVFNYNGVLDGYTNGPPFTQKRKVFLSPVNGHGVFTNVAGYTASNTIPGYTGFQTWSNISFPSNVNFSAEFVVSVATSNTAATLQSSTMNYGQFGYGFWEPTSFGNPLSTPGLFPVKVSADGLYWKIGTAPSKILGLTGGASRDPALSPKINGWYGMTYTTNSIATVVTNISAGVTNVYPAQTNSSAVTMLISSNLLDWQFCTNLTFFKTNESIPSTNASTWEGKWCVVGPQVWMISAVCTNAAKLNFELRIRTTSTNDFPHSWSEPIVLSQNTYSNLIDGTPYFTGTNVIMAAKDNSTTYTVIGTFASTNPASTFTWTINNPGSPVWGGGWEGLNWHTFYGTNGLKTYGLSQRFYQGPSRGNGGDAYVTGLAISTNPAANGFWSGMTNIYVPRGPQGEYLQNFQLMDLNTAEERDMAEAIINQQSGNYGLMGIFPAKPSTTQFTLFGWPYVEAAANPIPGNFAGVWLAPGSGVGFYGTSLGTNYLSATSTNRAQTNVAGLPNSIDVLSFSSDSLLPLVPIKNATFNSDNTNVQMILGGQGQIAFTNKSSGQWWSIENTNNGFTLNFKLNGATLMSLNNAGLLSPSAISLNGQTALDSDTFPNYRMPAPRYRVMGSFLVQSNVVATNGFILPQPPSTLFPTSSIPAGVVGQTNWALLNSGGGLVALATNMGGGGFLTVPLAPTVTTFSVTNYTLVASNIVYTNFLSRGRLYGEAWLKTTAGTHPTINVLYTNSGVGYTLNIDVPSGINASTFFKIPFSVPLNLGAAFKITPIQDVGTDAMVTNCIIANE